MRKIAYSLIALAMTAFTFTSCEDVPAPFGQPEDPGSGGGGTVVVEPKGSGTEADPYNVAAVKAKTETLADGESIKDVYTKGYICQIDEIDITGTYGNSTYWISDDAEGKSGKYEVYRGVGLGGQKFNEAGATIIKEGDLVIIKGTIKNFRGTTPEYDAGSILVELNGVPAGGGGGTTPTETLGTKDAPLSIAQALELINKLADKAESEQFAYVKGKVVKVTTNQANFDQYGNLNYLISEDGTENGSTITVYSGDGLNGAKFSGPGDLAQGDEVIVYGKLYKYVNNSGKVTPEINKGNYLVSLVKGSGGGGGGDTPSGETLGTKDSPLNVAQALELINALADKAESEKFAFVKGKVVKVTTNQANFDSYGNLNYLISDDGTENNTVTVYGGDGLNGAKFSGPGDLEPGDEVIVYGKLYKYVNSKGVVTPEINKGNYLVSLVKGSGGGGGESGGGDTPSSLTNGNFETWADGLPTGWKSASTASSATLKQSTDAHGGNYSVIVVGDEGNNKRLASQEITLAAGTYVFSFYAKATAEPAQVRPGYVPVSSGKAGSYAYGNYADITSGSWTLVSHEFTLNAETTLCLVVMNPKKSNYSSGKDVLIDDATLTKK